MSEAPVVRQRPPHDTATILRMRRERLRPGPGQWDEHHLRVLLRGLTRAFDRLPPTHRPILDLWCGVQPYAPLIPGRTIGVDLDLHFGSADLVAVPPLPLRSDAFAGALCSQALHIVDDPQATVDELRRVVEPRGWVVVTVPDHMLRVGPSAGEGRLRRDELATLFDGFSEVTIEAAGGPGAAFAHGAGLLASVAVRRLRIPSGAARALYAATNLVGRGIDLLTRPLHRYWPHLLIITARV